MTNAVLILLSNIRASNMKKTDNDMEMKRNEITYSPNEALPRSCDRY